MVLIAASSSPSLVLILSINTSECLAQVRRCHHPHCSTPRLHGHAGLCSAAIMGAPVGRLVPRDAHSSWVPSLTQHPAGSSSGARPGSTPSKNMAGIGCEGVISPTWSAVTHHRHSYTEKMLCAARRWEFSQHPCGPGGLSTTRHAGAWVGSSCWVQAPGRHRVRSIHR